MKPDTEFVFLFSMKRHLADADGYSLGNVDLFLSLGPGQGSPFCGLGWNGMRESRWQVSVWAVSLLGTPFGAKSDSGQTPQVVGLHLYPESLSAMQKSFLWNTEKLQGNWTLAVHGPGPFAEVCFARVHGVSQVSFSPVLLTLQLVLIQSVSMRSLLHKWPCMDRPLRKPAVGAVSGPSGKEAHLHGDVPCSLSQGWDSVSLRIRTFGFSGVR